MTSTNGKSEQRTKPKKQQQSIDTTQIVFDNHNINTIKTTDLLNKIEQNARNEDSVIRSRINNEIPTNSSGNNTSTVPNTLGSNIDPHLMSIYNYYRLNVNTIPSYVIDRLTHTYKNDENAINSFSDPFTETFKDDNNNVKWGEFLKTIKIAKSDIPVSTSLQYDNGEYESGNPQAFIDEISYGRMDMAIEPYLPVDEDDEDDINDMKYELELAKEAKIKKTRDDALLNSIFKNYDLRSNWNGDTRLKGLFESPDDMILDCREDDESDDDSDDISSGYSRGRSGRSGDDADTDIDLEKGYKKRRMRLKRKFNLRRLRRERDLKERAMYWIEENKKTWKPKLFESIRTNSYFPLFFRLISLTLSSIALGLAARVVKMTQGHNISQQPSPLMAMIVQAVSILYLFYITYDEFTSQPLGLRNPRAKIRLIMLDLIFIIFLSANLSLSFESIYDSRWVCRVGSNEFDGLYDSGMCVKVKALTAFLFLTLIIWCVNFSISVFRVVHVVSYREKS